MAVVWDAAGALVEHEYDHVFVGEFSGQPAPDPSEVEAWRWVEMDDLRRDLRERPWRYSYWLKAAIEGDEGRRLDALLKEASSGRPADFGV